MTLLRQFCADEPAILGHYRKEFSLTPTQARITHFLAQVAPRAVSKEQIFGAVWPVDSETESRIIDVTVCHVRAKGIGVETVHGVGYAMPEEEAERVLPRLPEAEPRRYVLSNRNEHFLDTREPRPWTDEDDLELLRMRDNGSEWWAIAQELGRTERACTCRYYVLQADA